VLRLAAMTAVTGYEDAMSDSLRALLPGARADRAGNVIWTRGSGAPVRVAICSLDEVGYVVGGIGPDGYLTLRRVGATPMGPLFDQFLEGQRVTAFGRSGPVAGVVAVRSTHLQRGRAAGADEPFGLDNAYVDVGASSPAGVAALGIELLAPLARTKVPHRYGDGLLAAPFAVQRAACAALVAAVRRAAASPGAAAATGEPAGTAVAVFARRRHFGHDGAGFALLEAAGPLRGAAPLSVVLVGGTAPADSLGTGAPLQTADSIIVPGGARAVSAWPLPARYARSPVETISLRDVETLYQRLVAFLGVAVPR
jgi:putative aminopeptidase FrvX